jgi:hypothetical protein
MLEEIHLHGAQPPQPTIAIWADGRAVFTKEVGDRFEHLNGQLPPATAEAIARDVFSDVEGVARNTDVEVGYSSDGGQVTTIVVRQGSKWRGVSLYGDYRDDFLADPHQQVQATPPVTDGPYTLVPADIESKRDPPPPGFARAYRRLDESIPTHGWRHEPDGFDIRFFGPDKATAAPLHDLAWPSSLPGPPDDLQPLACDPHTTDGCPYSLDAAYTAAAAQFREQLVVDNKSRVVNIGGRRFMVGFDSLYRGQHSVDAVIECGRQLVRASRATQIDH